MAVRPLTRNQQLQHRAFLKALGKTGNAHMAATEIGVHNATLHSRRSNHPDFATAWDAALVAAKARLHRSGGAQGSAGDGLRATGGEPTVTLLGNGRLQVRAARRNSLTKACEQAFLAALSATANVSLSAAAAGASVASFNRRRRRDPDFAREMRLALAEGVTRLEEALVAGSLPSSHADDAWRHNEPPAVPPMTAAQMLQLLYLHGEKAKIARRGSFAAVRRGDPATVRNARVRARYREQMLHDAEKDEVDRLAAATARLPPSPHETPVALPDLAQVTGWSQADPTRAAYGDRALFGGWRNEQLAPEQQEEALAKGRRIGPGRGRRGCRRAAEAAVIEVTEALREAAEIAAADTREAAALAALHGGAEDGGADEARRWLFGVPREDGD